MLSCFPVKDCLPAEALSYGPLSHLPVPTRPGYLVAETPVLLPSLCVLIITPTTQVTSVWLRSSILARSRAHLLVCEAGSVAFVSCMLMCHEVIWAGGSQEQPRDLEASLGSRRKRGEIRRPMRDLKSGRRQQILGMFGNLGSDRSQESGEKSRVAFGFPGWVGWCHQSS